MPELPDAGPQRRGSAILPLSSRKSGVGSADLYGSPQLTLTLGRDRHSSGVSVWLWTPTGSHWPSVKLLMGERWQAPLPGEEGCVELAITALQSILGEIRGIGEAPPV